MNNTIRAEAVRDRADELFVLDVRPAYSYHENHIVESHNLPIYDQLAGESFIGLDASLDELPDDQEIAVVCFSGSKASLAAEHLRKRGYDAKALIGGMSDWPYETVGEAPAATVRSIQARG
ncbi:rhodanese-like domain-containing protein [Halarchaeum sp. P4]|uniref:rhodanese-like domain-containing protein n=1 Tax=Halarchaeum sp. P4 TaxID=3421639 RepID=UPI003EB6FFF9